MISIISFSIILIFVLKIAHSEYLGENYNGFEFLGCLLLAASVAFTGFIFCSEEEYKKQEVSHAARAKLEGDSIIVVAEGMPTLMTRDSQFLGGAAIVEVRRWNIWGGELLTEYHIDKNN